MAVLISRGPLPVKVSHNDLADCVDVLLDNAFTHTLGGCGMSLS